VPVLFTEQNATGLGGTLPELLSGSDEIAHKMTFDACRAPGGKQGDRTSPNGT
jgi:hypothetical protein